ncbi:MAG: radical SAM family heme chaperone HemW [Muribaculaceae bacterium]|nr:radical SAM family heme chaperone HemW [Muribaculaceae bacterium]
MRPGLYIHVPFCAAKCAYCDFYSLRRPADMERWTEAVITEYALRAPHYLPDPSVGWNTLYIGGGTPSSLPLPLLSRLMASLSGIHRLEEATIEANPEDVTPRWLEAVAGLGFNRVSMGIQSFDDAQLSDVGRRHDSATARRALTYLAGSGLDFSADLIYGLPGQSLESWQHSLRALLDFSPSHFSAYHLSYEPGTRLYARLQAGKVTEASDSLVADMYALLTDEASRRGYLHYEISNFALPGHEAIHNSSYWDYRPYLGLGPGAHSFSGTARASNPPHLSRYLSALLASDPALPLEVEEESAAELVNDLIITALRTSRGLSLTRLSAVATPAQFDVILSEARKLAASGLLLLTDTSIVIPERNFLLSDHILRSLILES